MRPTLDSYALEIPTILNSNIWRRHISSSDVWIVVTCLLQMWQSTHLKKTWTIHTSEEVMNNSHIWRSHVTRHATNMSHVTHMYLKSMGPTRNSDAHPWSTYNSHIWRSHVTRHVTYLRHITYTSCHTSCHIFETCHIHVMSHVMSHIWDMSHTRHVTRHVTYLRHITYTFHIHVPKDDGTNSKLRRTSSKYPTIPSLFKSKLSFWDPLHSSTSNCPTRSTFHVTDPSLSAGGNPNSYMCKCIYTHICIYMYVYT